MQKLLEGDISEIPFKQRSIAPMSLDEYQLQSSTRNEAIIKAFLVPSSSSCFIEDLSA